MLRDAAGGGAAPQGEARMVTDYVSATGFFQHAAFSVALSTDDVVMIIHPTQYEPVAMRGGAETLESLDDELDAMLDMAEDPLNTLLMDGSEQDLYEITGQAWPFYFAGGFIDWTGLNAGGGEDTVIRVKIKVDGTNYALIYEETFLAVAVPNPATTPFPRAVNTRPTPEGFYCKQDVTVTAEQLAVGAGWNTLSWRIIDAVRGT